MPAAAPWAEVRTEAGLRRDRGRAAKAARTVEAAVTASARTLGAVVPRVVVRVVPATRVWAGLVEGSGGSGRAASMDSWASWHTS